MIEQDKPFKDMDDALDYTQSIRKRVVDSLCSDGTVPNDKENRVALLATLDGIDKQVLGVARLKQDDKNSADDRAIAERIALINRGVNRNPNELRDADVNTLPERHLIDENALGEIEMVEGETMVGIPTENFNDFLGRVEP